MLSYLVESLPLLLMIIAGLLVAETDIDWN